MSVNLRTAPVAKIGAVGAVLSVAVPLAVSVLMLKLSTALMRRRDPLRISLLLGRATVLVLAAVLAELRVSMAWCLVVLALAPLVTVVDCESLGHRHRGPRSTFDRSRVER